MKLTIPSAAALLLAAGASADVDIGFYGDINCTPIHKFNFATAPTDGSCKSIGPIVGAFGAELQDCPNNECICTLFVSSDCDRGQTTVPIANMDGQPTGCDQVAGLTFSSVSCVALS